MTSAVNSFQQSSIGHVGVRSQAVHQHVDSVRKQHTEHVKCQHKGVEAYSEDSTWVANSVARAYSGAYWGGAPSFITNQPTPPGSGCRTLAMQCPAQTHACRETMCRDLPGKLTVIDSLPLMLNNANKVVHKHVGRLTTPNDAT